MKNTMRMLFAVLALASACINQPAVALERSAGGNDVLGDNQGVMRRVQALEAAMTALYNPLQARVTDVVNDMGILEGEVDTLKTQVAALLYCNSIQKTYDPTNAARDARGCVPIPGVAEMLYCNSIQRTYDPTNPAKDARGCVSIVDGFTLKSESFSFSLADCSGIASKYGWNSCAKTYSLKSLLSDKAIFTDVKLTGKAGDVTGRKTYSFTHDLGSLGSSISTDKIKVADDLCSEETLDSYYSATYSPTTMNLTVTGWVYNAGDKARCFSSDTVVATDVLRLTGQKMFIAQ